MPSLWFGIIEPGDVLYLPPNLIMLSKAVNATSAALRLSLQQVGAPPPHLEIIIDVPGLGGVKPH